MSMERTRRKISDSSCIPKSLPLKGNPITRVIQVAQRIKRAKPLINKVVLSSIKTAKIRIMGEGEARHKRKDHMRPTQIVITL